MSVDQGEFGALLKKVRTDCGMSLADLAGVTYVSRGWINNVEAGRRWPARPWVEHAEDALNASGRLLRVWDKHEHARASDGQVRQLLATSVRESELLLASAPDAVGLDVLQRSVVDLAVAYLAKPARPMLEQGMSLRQELSRRFSLGAVRPHELADLYLALGRVSGVLAYAAVDLGNAKVASIHSRTAFHMGGLAGDNELRAWARGTQSLIARFDKHYERARLFVEDGLTYAGQGTSEVRLLCGAAQCAANLGDADGALAFISRAKTARDRVGVDSVEGVFGFSPAKQAYYSASSLMWLPEKHSLQLAEARASEAIATWEHEPAEQRSFDDEALAHVYLATARARLGDVEGAMDAVRPVIELPEERQISWIRKRVGGLAEILDGQRFRNSPTVESIREELRAYSA